MKFDNNISPEELEIIERFITGQLSTAEAEAFRTSLASDPALQQKTDEVKLLILGINENAIESKLDQFHEGLESRKLIPAARMVTLRRRLLVAASIILIASIGAWALFLNGNRNERIYGRYYSPDPGLATVMSASSNYDFDKAMVEYKNGEYGKAYTSWTNLLKSQPANDTLIYFVGVSQQAAKLDDLGLANLTKIAADDKSTFQKDACWYLGLAYLKQSEKPKAIEYIQRSEHPQRTAILEAIK